MDDSTQGGLENIQWHTAFFQALQAELVDYKEALEFKHEYQLNAEPLRVDTLIIVKPPNVVIDKNIAKIFKRVNIWEFKSPPDYLSVKDFYKVCAYASLYAAITPDADMSDITLTFAVSRYPRKLVEYLTAERGYKLEKRDSGIYYIIGDYMPMQIIVSTELSGTDNRWLKDLARGLEREEALGILIAGRELKARTPLSAYFYALFLANRKIFQEVAGMGDGLAEFEDMLMETGILPKWIDHGRVEGETTKALQIARNLLKKGWDINEAAEIAELDPEKVRGLSGAY